MKTNTELENEQENRRKWLAVKLRTEAVQRHFDPLGELLDEAANLIDPPDDESKIKVRVLVRVDFHDGESGECHYTSAGWNVDRHDEFDGVLREHIDGQVSEWGSFTENPRWSYITARVPKPVPTAEIEGMVDS